MRRRAGIAAIVVTGALALGAVEGEAYLMRGSIVGNGGNTMSGSNRRLTGTVGQPAVGMSAGPTRIVCWGFWCAGGVRVVGVEDPVAGDLPTRLELGPAVPNPARGAVAFTLALPRETSVRLTVYDVRGREVETLLRGRMEPGVHHLRWSGDEPGTRLPAAGVYFAALFVDGAMAARRRIVLVR